MKFKKKSDIQNNEHTIKRRDIIIAIVAIIAFLSFMFFTLYYLDEDDTNSDYRVRHRKYNDGWLFIIDGERSNHDLPVKISSGEDDKILMKKVLPASVGKNDVIAMRNYHQVMEVKIDGETIFSYPDENWQGITNILSDEWSVINLNPSYARKTLEITLTNINITRFNGYISDIYYGEDNSVIHHLRDSNFWDFMSGVIMIVIGLILIGISWIYRKPTNQKPNAAMGAAFFCFGLWATNRSKMPFFSTNNNAIFMFSLIALIFAAPFVFLYSYYRNKEGKELAIRLSLIVVILAVFVIVTCTFIHYNVESIAMFSYIAIMGGFVYNGVLLYRASFGENSKLRNNIELALDRSEFFANLILPVASIVEMYASSHQLWTELSSAFRTLGCIYAIIYMIFVLWRTYLVVQDRVMVSERLQESQLELMMGQIQPHFIFNTLSSIRTLVKIDPDVAYSMLYDFSNYLRANVDNVTNMDGIMFAAEVNHIESYVNIEKVRFGDRLIVEYDILAKDFIVPPLSIQPLVENAIKHGVIKRPEGGTVWLRSFEDEQYYVVEVEDDGLGFSKEAASSIFSVYTENDDSVGLESNRVMIAAMSEIMESLTLLDEEGNPIELSGPVKRVDLSGNGSEQHHSKGLMNIFLRLREMSNAKIEIKSQIDDGTLIRVLFPKDENSN